MELKNPFAYFKKKKSMSRGYEWVARHFASLFDQVADPVIVLRPEDIICHQIAFYAYCPPRQRPSQLGAYRLEHLLPDEERACVYVDHAKKNVIIGYRGTDKTDTKDLMSDVEIILGVSGSDQRVQASLRAYDLVRAQYPEYTKWICGHSLGGTICYIIAKHREPERCVVFNPGSAPNALFVQMLTDTVKKAAWVTHVFTYKILGDMVSTFSFVGNTKLFRAPTADPVLAHKLEVFNQPGITYSQFPVSEQKAPVRQPELVTQN